MRLGMRRAMTGILFLAGGLILHGCSDDEAGGSTSFESEADGSGFELQLDAGSSNFLPGTEGGGESSTGGPSFLDTSIEPPTDAVSESDGEEPEGTEGTEEADAEGSESSPDGEEYPEEGALAVTLNTEEEF